MQLEFEGKQIYIKEDKLSAIATYENKGYENEPIYTVDINVNGMMFRVATVSSQEKANQLVKLISAEQDVLKANPNQEPTYLDGFKQGTEYALKLIEAKGK